jgi:hypothetical protein
VAQVRQVERTAKWPDIPLVPVRMHSSVAEKEESHSAGQVLDSAHIDLKTVQAKEAM